MWCCKAKSKVCWKENLRCSEGEFADCKDFSSLDAFLVLSTSGVFPGYYLYTRYLIKSLYEILNLLGRHIAQLVKGGILLILCMK